MTDDEAWWWLTIGLGLVLVGVTLLRLNDPFLLTMWGVTLGLIGGAATVVGTGTLLRLWR